MFISGFLGWDDMALAEFHDWAELVPSPFVAIARMAHRTVQFASQLSPLPDSFPGQMAHEAALESAASYCGKRRFFVRIFWG